MKEADEGKATKKLFLVFWFGEQCTFYLFIFFFLSRSLAE